MDINKTTADYLNDQAKTRDEEREQKVAELRKQIADAVGAYVAPVKVLADKSETTSDPARLEVILSDLTKLQKRAFGQTPTPANPPAPAPANPAPPPLADPPSAPSGNAASGGGTDNDPAPQPTQKTGRKTLRQRLSEVAEKRGTHGVGEPLASAGNAPATPAATSATAPATAGA